MRDDRDLSRGRPKQSLWNDDSPRKRWLDEESKARPFSGLHFPERKEGDPESHNAKARNVVKTSKDILEPLLGLSEGGNRLADCHMYVTTPSPT